MAELRCPVTELLPAECAHCRRLPDPGAEPAEAGPVVTIVARYEGRCAGCGGEFPAGTTITKDAEGHGWIAGCCTEGGGDG